MNENAGERPGFQAGRSASLREAHSREGAERRTYNKERRRGERRLPQRIGATGIFPSTDSAINMNLVPVHGKILSE